VVNTLRRDRRDGARALCRIERFSRRSARRPVRTLVSDYPSLRTKLGLTCYGEAAVIEKLAAAGFSATRLPANIGHNPARMTFLARPA
jgi:hypothetical protein